MYIGNFEVQTIPIRSQLPLSSIVIYCYLGYRGHLGAAGLHLNLHVLCRWLGKTVMVCNNATRCYAMHVLNYVIPTHYTAMPYMH